MFKVPANKLTPKPKKKLMVSRRVLAGAGVFFLSLAFVLLGFGTWEAFGGFTKNIHTLGLPGFHEIDLAKPGVHIGFYQHRGTGPIPVDALSRLDVRLMSKTNYEEIPVLMNSGGQVFRRLGQEGMVLFSFAVERAGAYTLSGVYADAEPGPDVTVVVFPQGAHHVLPTLVVTVLFFLIFGGLGVLIFLKLNKWAPKTSAPVR